MRVVVQDSSVSRSPRVDLVEDVDLAVRIFRRGVRTDGAPCNLTIALNGREQISEDQQAGKGAPAEAVVDLRTSASVGEKLIQALRVQPWLSDDLPVIIFERPTLSLDNPNRIGYLVRSTVVEQVIEAVREVLDLGSVQQNDAMVEASPPLDAA